MRRLFAWFDRLTDWQRLRYVGLAILFLLACCGYLLGIGSVILLQRAEAEEAAIMAAAPLPTQEPTSTATPEATQAPSPTVASTATPLPPTRAPTQTLFVAPVIAEPPAAPRRQSAPAVIAPAAPRTTPTPPLPTPTPTPAIARTIRPTVATAVRAATNAPAVTARPTAHATQPATPGVPLTTAPTTAVLTPTRPPALTSVATATVAPVRTAGVR